MPVHHFTAIFFALLHSARCFKTLDKHVVSAEHTWPGLLVWNGLLSGFFFSIQHIRKDQFMSNSKTKQVKSWQSCNLVYVNVDVVEWYFAGSAAHHLLMNYWWPEIRDSNAILIQFSCCCFSLERRYNNSYKRSFNFFPLTSLGISFIQQ